MALVGGNFNIAHAVAYAASAGTVLHVPRLASSVCAAVWLLIRGSHCLWKAPDRKLLHKVDASQGLPLRTCPSTSVHHIVVRHVLLEQSQAQHSRLSFLSWRPYSSRCSRLCCLSTECLLHFKCCQYVHACSEHAACDLQWYNHQPVVMTWCIALEYLPCHLDAVCYHTYMLMLAMLALTEISTVAPS